MSVGIAFNDIVLEYIPKTISVGTFIANLCHTHRKCVIKPYMLINSLLYINVFLSAYPLYNVAKANYICCMTICNI